MNCILICFFRGLRCAAVPDKMRRGSGIQPKKYSASRYPISAFFFIHKTMCAKLGIGDHRVVKKMTNVSPKHHITAMQLLYASKHKIRIEQKGDEQCIGKAEQ